MPIMISILYSFSDTDITKLRVKCYSWLRKSDLG